MTIIGSILRIRLKQASEDIHFIFIRIFGKNQNWFIVRDNLFAIFFHTNKFTAVF